MYASTSANRPWRSVHAPLALCFVAGCALCCAAAPPATARHDLRQKAQQAALAQQWNQVLEILRAIDEQSDDPVVRLIKAHACLAVNRNNESVCLFLSVLRREDLEAYHGWASILASNHPRSRVAYYFLGDSAARLGLWPEAISAYDKGLRLQEDSDKALLHNARGVAYAYSNQPELARRDFEEAKDAAPRLADAWANIGALRIHRKTGATGALKALQRALDESPEFALALHQRGCVKLILNQQDAAADLKLAVEKATCNAALGLMLANQIRYVGKAAGVDPQEALADLRQAGTELKREYRQQQLEQQTTNLLKTSDALRNAKALPFNQHLANFFGNRAVERMETMGSDKAVEFLSNSPYGDLGIKELNRVAGYNEAIRGYERTLQDVGTLTAVLAPDPRLKAAGGIAAFSGHKTGDWSDRHVDFAYKLMHGDLKGLAGQGLGGGSGSLSGAPGTSPGGVHIRLADINWDEGDWPFKPCYGLSYERPELPEPALSTMEGSCTRCVAKTNLQ